MGKFNKKEIQEALENKRSLEKFLEKSYEYSHGELEEFSYNNGCEISNKLGIQLESIITGSYSTNNYGQCYCRKIRIECIDTSIVDMDGKKIFYDVVSKKPFIVKITPADGWEIGWISVKNPRMISEKILKEYEEWKTSCKKYNEEQILKVSKILGTSKEVVANFKGKNNLNTFTLIKVGECIQSMFISRNLLSKFQEKSFTWSNYYNFFEESFGNLPFTIRIIEMALVLLEVQGYENNAHILSNK